MGGDATLEESVLWGLALRIEEAGIYKQVRGENHGQSTVSLTLRLLFKTGAPRSLGCLFNDI